MACFIAPAAEAVITTIVTKVMESKEKKMDTTSATREDASCELAEKMPFSRKLKWLTNMLWGGSALLAFEHVWHGELTFLPPFLTAAANPADTAEMLHEIATAGVGMAAIVTLVWIGMVAAASAIEKRAVKERLSKN